MAVTDAAESGAWMFCLVFRESGCPSVWLAPCSTVSPSSQSMTADLLTLSTASGQVAGGDVRGSHLPIIRDRAGLRLAEQIKVPDRDFVDGRRRGVLPGPSPWLQACSCSHWHQGTPSARAPCQEGQPAAGELVALPSKILTVPVLSCVIFHACPLSVPFLANKMGRLANRQKENP